MSDKTAISNYLLAGGTILAATFVAVQAWYARSSFVEAEATRFLERKLDICFENFDSSAQLDAALRRAVPGMEMQPTWPPKIVVESPTRLRTIKRDVVPMLDALEAGLTKAQVLGGLDKYRAYLAQQLRGLSKRVMDVTAVQVETADPEAEAVFATLSDFIGAQYSVFTGCRLVAQGEA